MAMIEMTAAGLITGPMPGIAAFQSPGRPAPTG
jgi:hypothetical protein